MIPKLIQDTVTEEIYTNIHESICMYVYSVPRLEVVLTSTNTLLARVIGTAPGNNVVSYVAGRRARGDTRGGPRHGGNEEMRKPNVTVKTIWRLRHRGDTKTPSRLWVLVHVQLYG